MLLLKTSLISSTISNQYFYEASTKVLKNTIKIDRFLEDFDTRKRAGNRGNTSRAERGMVLSINYTTKLHSLKFSGQTERAHQIHVQKSCCRGAYQSPGTYQGCSQCYPCSPAGLRATPVDRHILDFFFVPDCFFLPIREAPS